MRRRFPVQADLALALAFGLLLGLASDPATGATASDPVEVVGAVAVREGEPSAEPPRQAALREALGEAARAAAFEMLAEARVPADPESVSGALGDDPFAYVLRFRLLEDYGERPARTVDEREAEREYAVRLEVHVDRDRVRERLASAGLLPVDPGPTALRTIRVVVEGLTEYPAYRAIRDGLAGQAASVRPVEFVPGQATLEVEAERSPEELLSGLFETLPEEVRVAPIEVDRNELRIRADPHRASRAARPLYGGADLGEAGASPVLSGGGRD